MVSDVSVNDGGMGMSFNLYRLNRTSEPISIQADQLVVQDSLAIFLNGSQTVYAVPVPLIDHIERASD